MLARVSTRLAVVAGLFAVLAALMVAVGTSAFAGDGWGKVECRQNPLPGCELGSGRHRDKDDGDNGDGSGDGSDDGSDQSDGSDGGEDDSEWANCRYVRSDYQPPTRRAMTFDTDPDDTEPDDRDAGESTIQAVAFGRNVTEAAGVQPAAPGDEDGAWYVYRCSGKGYRDALYRAPVWIPDREAPRGPAPSPEDLTEEAWSQLRLPDPKIQSSPAGEQMVNLPTWLWLGEGSWRTVTATASVPGVSVTAVAKPTLVSWSMGDGESATCDGPGTPFQSDTDPKESSPDCGYTYTTSSAGQPDKAFPVEATTHWRVTWHGAGGSGVFPDMTTSATTEFTVVEAPALNTD